MIAIRVGDSQPLSVHPPHDDNNADMTLDRKGVNEDAFD